MTSTYLIDANVLIALVLEDHEHHDRALTWIADVERLAVCPIVEGALVRSLVRLAEGSATADAALEALRKNPRVEFWPDALSYRDVDLTQVTGHRQVTDAYLTALATRNDARLATFDRALARTNPAAVTLIG